MPQNDLSYEAMASLLYRLIMDKATELDNKNIDDWAAASLYNRKLIDDLRNDIKLRQLLMDCYFDHPEKFWDIVVVYRAAMHD